MKIALEIAALSALLFGCGPAGSPTTGPVPTSGGAPAFEGRYIVVGSSEAEVIMTNGVYVGGRASNPGGDINGGGKYQARKINDATWELDMVYQEGGTGVVVVRTQGDSVWMRDKAFGGEAELKKKSP